MLFPQSKPLGPPPPVRIDIPRAFEPLLVPTPGGGKIFYGGRMGAKSHSYARAIIARMYTEKKRVLCAREFQTSIKDSVHYLLKNTVSALGLTNYFDITNTEIRSFRGSEAIFKGLKRNIDEIKSTEGIDICWVEEGQSVSSESLQVLLPTIRKPDAEVWISYNPFKVDAPVHQMALNPPPGWISRKVGWQDNPYFPESMHKQRLHMLATDPIAYEHVWNGGTLIISDAVIFKDRVIVETFETPHDARFFHGADWGFSTDPTALVRCYIKDEHLFVDMEAFSWGAKLDQLGELFDTIPTSRKWPIKADNSRPETIAFMASQGFNISGARKWNGSVEDGIEYLKKFKMIHIHERCENLALEARLYQYVIDPVTKEILPLVLDKHNHGWDALRYALDYYIRPIGVGLIVMPFVASQPRDFPN